MSDIGFAGLGWAVWVFAATAIALVAAVVQPLVVGIASAAAGSRGQRLGMAVAASLVGPAVAFAVALLGGVLVRSLAGPDGLQSLSDHGHFFPVLVVVVLLGVDAAVLLTRKPPTA